MIIRFAISFPSYGAGRGRRTLPPPRPAPRVSLSESASEVQEQGAVDAVAEPVLAAEKFRRVVLGADADEAVVAAQPPAAGVPLHAGADVAGEGRCCIGDPETRLFEHAEPADPADDVWHNGALVRYGHHEVAAVVQDVGRPLIRRRTAELERLREAERPADLAFDADVAIEVDTDRCAEVVVAESRLLGISVFGEENPSARNDAEFDASGSRSDLL